MTKNPIAKFMNRFNKSKVIPNKKKKEEKRRRKVEEDRDLK